MLYRILLDARMGLEFTLRACANRRVAYVSRGSQKAVQSF